MYTYVMHVQYIVDQCDGCNDRMPAKFLDNTNETQLDQ